MQLIPEQISILRKREKDLLGKYADYKDYLKDREIIGSEATSISQVGDSIIETQYQRDLNELREIRKILETADYVTERPLDKIGIGTKFVIRFTGDTETNALMLTDFSSAVTGLYKLISTASPVGKAVMGKQAGEEFQTVIIDDRNRTRRVSTGTIESIEISPAAYLHFIREKEFRLRRSKKDKADVKEIKQLPSTEQQAKIEERFAITESQRSLLFLEKERLEREPNSGRRLWHVNKMLNTAPIATPPTDGTIGIGSTFDVVIGDGENAETRHYELINRAVTDELEDVYIEKISSFGEKFYGLKTGDIVSFKQNRKTQTAKVINVDIPEKEISAPQFSKK